MNRTLFITTLLFFAASCNRSQEVTPEQIAHTFLTAYFSLDFDQTLPLCGEALKTDLERSAKTIGSLSQAAQDKLRNDLTVYSFKLEKVAMNSAKDSAFVSYMVMTPEAPEGIPSHLTMAKEEQEWRVVKLL